MRYGSICSGIEAATVAWEPLGWRPAFFSEIDKFPRAVLAHHYPDVPLHGDFTTIQAGDYEPIDLLVGGTPRQSFSAAGKRLGLDDPRGNLAIEYCRLARRLRPRWIVWENVPGVLSSSDGRDFGAFLGLLGECGYGFAYRVLDAQYVRVDGYARAVPQRRQRVFVVGHLGDWRRAASVLFEPASMRGDNAPSREEEAVAGALSANGVGTCGADDNQGQAGHLIPIAFTCKDYGADAQINIAPTLRAMGHSDSHANAGGQLAVVTHSGVRRLMPVECERLQGFPDGFTDVPWRSKGKSPDGPRYKALGNSMAVNVMRWIGTRIAAAEAVIPQIDAQLEALSR